MAIASRSDSESIAALLEIAKLIARGAPDEVLFATVAEYAARRLGTDAASVLRYVGDERAVVVGVWRHGTRGLPVNAELDFESRHSALGRVKHTRRPARAERYSEAAGELAVIMRAVDIRATVAAPVMVGDEVWGAIAASMTTEKPLPADGEQLLGDFTDLVALAVANAEARRRDAASRVRLIEAADDTRRRLERALHEGVQQHLLALTLKLRLAHGRADTDPALAGLLEDALAEAAIANATLRDLARGLYPKVLSERGLAAAVQALTARAPVAAALVELPSRRFAGLAEATAYFAVADVLETAAAATEATVRIGDRGDTLVVEVRAEGGAAPPGLAERVAAVGGRLVVEAERDCTIVRAELPV
jgi:GAF domain-containing protein